MGVHQPLSVEYTNYVAEDLLDGYVVRPKRAWGTSNDCIVFSSLTGGR